MNWRWNGAALLLTMAVALFAVIPGCGSGEPVAANIATDDADNRSADSTNVSSGDGGAISTSVRSEAELHPLALIETSEGDITVRLDMEKTPRTVENFLETYADRKHYDQTIFHYVEKGVMILGGGFTSDLELKETRAEIRNEAHSGLKNRRGTIAMARDPEYVHSGTCQFFFNLADNSSLDHKSRDNAEEYGYCVFGEVVEGMDVLGRIAKVEVRDTDEFPKLPVKSVVIQSIRRSK